MNGPAPKPAGGERLRPGQPPVAPVGPGPGGQPLLQAGTLPRAAVTGAAILGVVGVIAWLGFSRESEAPLERYLRLGPDGAAAALRRDLGAEFPTGAPIAPLIRRLEGMGLGCAIGETGRTVWTCSIAVRADRLRATQVQVLASGVGDRLVSLETAVTDRPQ